VLRPRGFAALEERQLAHYKIPGRAANRGQTILFLSFFFFLGMGSYMTDKKPPIFGQVPEPGENCILHLLRSLGSISVSEFWSIIGPS